jgi:AraC-like DNA-binding protein
MSVTTTALEVGYATPSAYIYAFKRKFGMPPTQFRE